MTVEIERWAPIPGFEDRYEVSDAGRVRSLRRGIYLTLQKDKSGYPIARLKRGALDAWRPTVHSLVLLAFVGPRPFDRAIIRHMDGVKTNPALTNLRYGTHSENGLDKRRLGELAPPRTHCIRGHEFDRENTYVSPRGVRGCRLCRDAATLRHRTRRAAAA